jgi:hypothetical protein
MAQQVLVAAGELDSEGDGVGMCVVPQGALCGPAHPTHHTGPYVDQQYLELCAVHMQFDCTQGCLVDGPLLPNPQHNGAARTRSSAWCFPSVAQAGVGRPGLCSSCQAPGAEAAGCIHHDV